MIHCGKRLHLLLGTVAPIDGLLLRRPSTRLRALRSALLGLGQGAHEGTEGEAGLLCGGWTVAGALISLPPPPVRNHRGQQRNDRKEGSGPAERFPSSDAEHQDSNAEEDECE